MATSTQYRTIWLSDLHLATRGCKVEPLLDFLRHNDAVTLYLVGDIVDGWRMKRTFYWPQGHNDVIQKLLRKVRKGTRTFYLPGNHDEAMRACLGYEFGGVRIVDEWVHATADGRRLLVMHGDRFDGIVRRARWLAHLGDASHHALLVFSDALNRVRRHFGFTYWSLSDHIKQRVKSAVETMTHFKILVAGEAHARGLDGVICGHLHQPELQNIDGVLYCNLGDWVENSTALVEHHDGRLELIRWVCAPCATEGAVS